jgi:hypothetical protein
MSRPRKGRKPAQEALLVAETKVVESVDDLRFCNWKRGGAKDPSKHVVPMARRNAESLDR